MAKPIPVTRAPAGGKGLALDERGLVPTNTLGTGTADSTTVLHGDRTWSTVPAGGSPPTGTGFRHVTAGAEDAASKLVDTADINNDQVTYAKMQNVSATARLLGRITAAAGDAEELTGTQATTLLDLFTAVLKGLVPPSGGGSTAFLRADGTWAAPTAAAHHATHEPNGSDHLVIATGSYQPGTMTIPDLQYAIFADHYTIGVGESLTLQGNAVLRGI